MWRRLRLVALGLLAASLAGCSGYSSKSNFSLPTILPFGTGEGADASPEGKGTVLISSSIQGLSCAEKRIVLAQAEGDGFRTVRQERIDSTFDGGTGAAVMELDPGTYHIVEVACRNGAAVVHAGTNPAPGAVPWQAEHWTRELASFSLAPGQVLDAGELVLAPVQISGFGSGIDGRKADMTVAPSQEAALAEIVRARPELAPKLQTSWMTVSADSGVVLAKCHLISPGKPLATDGSSKIPDALAAYPEAKPALETLGWATTDAKACAHDTGAGTSPLGGGATAAQ
jgi:hypothetical protein